MKHQVNLKEKLKMYLWNYEDLFWFCITSCVWKVNFRMWERHWLKVLTLFLSLFTCGMHSHVSHENLKVWFSLNFYSFKGFLSLKIKIKSELLFKYIFLYFSALENDLPIICLFVCLFKIYSVILFHTCMVIFTRP